MSQNLKKNRAPKVSAAELWQMNGEDFNNWRRQHDFPRIISFFKEKLPKFNDWMESQNISDGMLIKHFPSSFIKERKEIYLYNISNDNQIEDEILLTDNYKVGQTIFHKKLIKKKTKIIPYPNWFYIDNSPVKLLNMHIGSSEGRSHYFMNELELLDLGNYNLEKNYFFDSKNLDFVNLDNLNIDRALNNTYLRIWFSSAINMVVNGDLAFVDTYKTPFYEVWNSQYSNLRLINGRFQNWSFIDCGVQLKASNSTLIGWLVNGYDFTAVLDLCDIRDSNFLFENIKFPIGLGRANSFHKHIKLLYSQLGKKKEASRHYFLEKTYERKSYLKIKENHRNEYYKFKKSKKILLPLLYIKYFIKYLISGLLNILWGYGEKPKRVFYISGVTVIIFAALYYFYPNSSPKTKGDFINSIYFSLVTFSTLGSSDIIQTDYILRLLSGLESILGVSFWGILIAGFSNNAKDY